MMAAINPAWKYNAIVFSNYDRQRFEVEYLKKLERFRVRVVQVISPDRGALPKVAEEVDTIIALVGMMSHAQYGVIKKWAKQNDRRFVHLEKHASNWGDTFGPPVQPTLALVPPPKPSEPQGTLETWIEPQVVVEDLPKLGVPEVDENAELAKLYAIDNAELRMKLAEVTKTQVDPAELEQLKKTRQKNAAALAVKTKALNNLEAENLELYTEVQSLKMQLSSAQPLNPQELDRFTKQAAEREAELAAKRRTMSEWEARMRQTVEEKKGLETELSQAREKIALLTRQQPQPKEVIVDKGKENVQKLIAGLQTMIDEGMMTADEAFKKLAAKYK